MSMVDVVRRFIQKYYETGQSMELKRKRSLEDARKDFVFAQYLDLDQKNILRKDRRPCGLRNIGNTCYFNMFIQLLYSINCIRDPFLTLQPQYARDNLSTELQTLFAMMMLSRFSSCDPTGVFSALNRSNPEKIQLGDQYDFYEYFSITLETLEKCLAREPVFQGKDKLLQKVFYGMITQYLNDGNTVTPTNVKFGIINLDVKHGSFEKAFEASKNYVIEGYKNSQGQTVTAKVRTEIVTYPGLMVFSVNRVGIVDGALTKDNRKFTFPEFIEFDKTTNSCVSKLSKQEEDLEQKIQQLQRLIQTQEHKSYLEALKKTAKFLQKQTDSTDRAKQLYCCYGTGGDIAAHTATQTKINKYIEKLEQQDGLLRKSLDQLLEQRAKKSLRTDVKQYRLLAVLIHDGIATIGHYYSFIYNENTRIWHKFNDREVLEVSGEEVHQTALGLLRSDTNVSCLVYKINQIKCDPTLQPTIHPTIKSIVTNNDEYLAQNIDRVRLQRILRNYSDVAKQQTQMFVESYKQDIVIFTQYFANPVYFFISSSNPKIAELYRLKILLTESSFVEDVRRSQLSKNAGGLGVPDIKLEVCQEYWVAATTIKLALDQEWRNNNILLSIYYLLGRKAAPNKYAIMKEMYEGVLVLFLLKACFYIDLKIQTRQNISELFELIKFACKSLPQTVYTRQIIDNVRFSLESAGLKFNPAVSNIKLTDAMYQKARPADHVDIERAFSSRFSLWKNFYIHIFKTKATLKQEDRLREESVLMVQYAQP